MAAFSFQHPFPHPFLLDSVSLSPHQNIATTAATSPAKYLNKISSPAGLFMEEPGSSAVNFPQIYPPELFLLHSSQSSSGFDDPANHSLPLQQQNNHYAFTSNHDCNTVNHNNPKAAGGKIGGVEESRNSKEEEEEASSFTRKQSTDGHSSNTEGGEQVTQFNAAQPTAADHTKKRKKLSSCNNLSNGSSHVTSVPRKPKEAREGSKSKKKAKKITDVEVEEETKKLQQGKTGDEKQSKKEQHQQRRKKKGADKERPPTGYIHVRARRGQATDSHSLAERARREKISERMKMLQHLVPGCDKVNGKALMLDEIINYIQSLQNQVEFLSMKLATVNPLFYDFGFDLDGFMVRPERLSSNVEVSTPLPSGQQCNPTTTAAAVSVAVSSAAANNCYHLLIDTIRPGAFSQSQDNGGNLLWDMEEEGSHRLVNESGFGIGSTTNDNNNKNKFC
ncbi:unnamed protein product [Linum trigynum]|uniref:BHLH domain-containing protein n=1 Tax=Linum trigynum TaxID=586398 RepID=A0AAV2G6B0_9ROSI